MLIITLNRIGERTEPWGEPFLNLPVQNKLININMYVYLDKTAQVGLDKCTPTILSAWNRSIFEKVL